MDTLLKVHGYIADIGDFPEYHRIYREEFGERCPLSSPSARP
jgi:hypothetical protein